MQIQVILLYYIFVKVSELEYRPLSNTNTQERVKSMITVRIMRKYKIQTTVIVVFPS